MDIHAYIEQHKARFLEEFQELLRIPSISTQPEHANDVKHAGQWVAEQMRQIGFEHVELVETEGLHPLVYGEWLQAGDNAPTVLIYSHYDVQPAVIEDGWDTPPFEPVIKDGKLFARGSLDSKIHVMAHLKAAETLLATGCPVNLKLLFEGEEESSGAHVQAFVQDNSQRLRADVVIVSDGSVPDPQQPVIPYGLRGILAMELHVEGPAQDLHSGHYGGTVHNPLQALAEILAQLHDSNGRVAVPGFYDDVIELEDEEREVLKQVLPFVEQEWETVTRAPQIWGEKEYTIHERICARPTLEINGMAGGYYETGFKTVLPARALAKISCRLVPYQNPQHVYECVKAYIEKIAPPSVKIELRAFDHAAPAVLTRYDSTEVQTALHAYEKAWGVKPLLTREGGSIPIVTTLQQTLNAPIVLMPFGYKGGRAHGPNEYIIVDMYYKGIETAIYYMHMLAEERA